MTQFSVTGAWKGAWCRQCSRNEKAPGEDRHMQGGCVPGQMDFAGPSWSTVHPHSSGFRPQEVSLPDHVVPDEVWPAGGTSGKAGAEERQVGVPASTLRGGLCTEALSRQARSCCPWNGLLAGLAGLAGGGRLGVWIAVQSLFPIP